MPRPHQLYRLIPIDEYYLGVLYFTGSNVFNQSIRKIALKKGFKLNEYSLRKVGPSGIISTFCLVCATTIENHESIIFNRSSRKATTCTERRGCIQVSWRAF
jgi:hypothetical protein